MAQFSFPMRLNQYIALAGICSRRKADRLIEAGAVTVNGEKAVLGRSIRWIWSRSADTGFLCPNV